MLIINKEQMEAFGQITLHQFEEEMLLHSKAFSSELYNGVSSEQLRVVIRNSIKQAKSYGFSKKGSIRLFIELFFLYGKDFDTDARYPEIGEILRSSDSQMQRAANIYTWAATYHEKVAGMEGVNKHPESGDGAVQIIDSSTQNCLLSGYKIVELVEVVEQDCEKLVLGAASDSDNTTLFDKKLNRTGINNSIYQQYINLEQDLIGKSKRHPEYGRKICFRARVEQQDGKTNNLSGVKVCFSNLRIDGSHRPQKIKKGDSPSYIWKRDNLKGKQKEGFNRKGGPSKTSATTDSSGWTPVISFYVSQYGGDRFIIRAKLHSKTQGANKSDTLETKYYEVWRRLWYQMSFFKGYEPPQPIYAENAFADVFVEMLLSEKKEITKKDFPKCQQNNLFVKQYMLKVGGRNILVPNITKRHFDAFKYYHKLVMKRSAEQPIKIHIISTPHLASNMFNTPILKCTLTSRSQVVMMKKGTKGDLICKPSLYTCDSREPKEPLFPFAFQSSWAALNKTGKEIDSGELLDKDITIDPNRRSTLEVIVTLPKKAPTPSADIKIEIKLSLFSAQEDAGGYAESDSDIILTRFEKNTLDYNAIVAHEIGHLWELAPIPKETRKLKMKPHPLQYISHGGAGPHCRYDAKDASGLSYALTIRNRDMRYTKFGKTRIPNDPRTSIDWRKNNDSPEPKNGKCLMFHRLTTPPATKFCEYCKPYIQLQNIKIFKKK